MNAFGTKTKVATILCLMALVAGALVGSGFAYSGSYIGEATVSTHYLSINVYENDTMEATGIDGTVNFGSEILGDNGQFTTGNMSQMFDMNTGTDVYYLVETFSNYYTSAYVYGYFTIDDTKIGCAIDTIDFVFSYVTEGATEPTVFQYTLHRDGYKEAVENNKLETLLPVSGKNINAFDLKIESVTINYLPAVQFLNKEAGIAMCSDDDGYTSLGKVSFEDATSVEAVQFHFLASVNGLIPTA